jgi:hypothetical protein
MTGRIWGPMFMALLMALGVGAIALIAYNVGYDNGLSTQVDPGAAPWRYGHGGSWFFPFLPFVLFPLFGLFLLFLLASAFRAARFGGMHRHGWAGGPGFGPGRWGPPRERIAEWHRHLHEELDVDEASPGHAASGGPSGAPE